MILPFLAPLNTRRGRSIFPEASICALTKTSSLDDDAFTTSSSSDDEANASKPKSESESPPSNPKSESHILCCSSGFVLVSVMFLLL